MLSPEEIDARKKTYTDGLDKLLDEVTEQVQITLTINVKVGWDGIDNTCYVEHDFDEEVIENKIKEVQDRYDQKLEELLNSVKQLAKDINPADTTKDTVLMLWGEFFERPLKKKED